MSSYYLSGPLGPGGPQPEPGSQVRVLSLESLDGKRQIRLDGSTGWWRLDGASGLEMPPFEVIRSAVPGVAGSALGEVRADERPVFVPVFTASDSGHVSHLQMLDEIRSLVDPLGGQFRLVGRSARGERALTVIYAEGLEGAGGRSESGRFWRKFGITAIACQPFAEARTDRVVPFQQDSAGGAFLGVAGGTDAPWPRALSSSSVIGEGMEVRVTSEVPVYPTLELTGPMDSFTGTLSPVVTDASGAITTTHLDSAWSVSVPQGVPAGSTLRLVTDPRARSIRMDGNLAAGRVARGSTLRPFFPGLNVLNVSAPGGNAATRIRLSWRELYRSLW